MLTKYKGYCSKCKKKTPHYIGKTSLKRGAKLTCLACGAEQKVYQIFLLEEFKEQEQQK
jgi:hypothetical protein